MILLKKNTNIKILIDDDGKILSYDAGNTLLVVRPHRHLFGISIQKKTGRIQPTTEPTS